MPFYLLMVLIIWCMVMSIRTIFIEEKSKKKFSMENLIWIANLYATILIGFALIYLLFELNHYVVILDSGMRIESNFFQQLETSFYFSAMTMFSVGYGDVSPVGIGRIIAAIEAFIGYSLPAAFLIRAVIDFEQHERRDV
ncbi:two pore domain potassium channel family protein [Peribacillus cavernae]|uniref:Two pore domain potassium channel family protein n=1 Tax=Peribacillus cavernae TaxID=1674310 RepID=A0A3S0VIE4_9BACI|nr:potassium channel family protein [Peribacillus cavernae]MDQ0220822.1 potassium channel LctB [Peribacillus cavernae]RUQ24831.1 two pore domain potassium channel family protein [Peribacillus cavernae]